MEEGGSGQEQGTYGDSWLEKLAEHIGGWPMGILEDLLGG